MPDLQPQTVIGPYRLLHLLGKGGMGEVYLAEHAHTGWKRALKILPEDLSENIPFVERFKREAAVLDSLKHPHIVQIYEMGESEGRYYIVMDYVEWSDGKPETLGDFQKKSEGRIKPETLGKLLIQVCNALEFAHSKGIVHRDLKPANILLKYKHGAIVSDFGLARVVGDHFLRSRIHESISASMSRGDANASIGADRTGGLDISSQALLGTWDYMSPEVKDGKEATTKSDIYALGVILYRCLTGAPKLSFELPSEIVPDLPATWDTLFRKSAATKPEKRYANCAEFLDQLGQCVNAGPAVAQPSTRLQDQQDWEKTQELRWERQELESKLAAAHEKGDRRETIRLGHILAEKGWLEGDAIDRVGQAQARLKDVGERDRDDSGKQPDSGFQEDTSPTRTGSVQFEKAGVPSHGSTEGFTSSYPLKREGDNGAQKEKSILSKEWIGKHLFLLGLIVLGSTAMYWTIVEPFAVAPNAKKRELTKLHTRGLVDNGDGTVTDQATGLMWIKDPSKAELGGTYDFHQANKACLDSVFAGHSDWKLPSIEVLAGVLSKEGGRREYMAPQFLVLPKASTRPWFLSSGAPPTHYWSDSEFKEDWGMRGFGCYDFDAGKVQWPMSWIEKKYIIPVRFTPDFSRGAMPRVITPRRGR